MAKIEAIARDAVDLADEYLPGTFPITGHDPAGVMLGVAATRHAANLLAGELDLALAGRWSLTRVLGRQITEAWLWANALMFDPAGATELLLAEDGNHQHRLEKGRTAIWEKLESKRAGGIDLRNLASVPATGKPPDVRVLAARVQELREAAGFGGGIAVVSYEQHYRWESVHDVHVTFDLLGRYVDQRGDSAAIIAVPGEDDLNALRGPETLHRDVGLVLDAVAVYLHATGQTAEITTLQQRASTLGS